MVSTIQLAKFALRVLGHSRRLGGSGAVNCRRTVLRQPKGDSGKDRRKPEQPDRLHSAAHPGDPGPQRGEIPDHGATPPWAGSDRRELAPAKAGANIYGVLVHAMLAVDADSGACLGPVGGDVWTRPGVNPTPHRERALEERESVHWLNTAQKGKQVLSAARRVTVVSDRDPYLARRRESKEARSRHRLRSQVVSDAGVRRA